MCVLVKVLMVCVCVKVCVWCVSDGVCVSIAVFVGFTQIVCCA